MGNGQTVKKQDSVPSKKPEVDAISGASPAAAAPTNAEITHAAELARYANDIPPAWRTVAGAMIPKSFDIKTAGQQITPPVAQAPAIAKFTIDAYTQFRKDETGWEALARYLGSVQDYIPHAQALSGAQRDKMSDEPRLKAIGEAVVWYTGKGDLKIAVTHLAGLHAALSYSGKRWMGADPDFLKPLVDYIAGKAWTDGWHDAYTEGDYGNCGPRGEARKKSSQSLLDMLKNPGKDPSGLITEPGKEGEKPGQLTKEQSDQLAEAKKKILGYKSKSQKNPNLSMHDMMDLQVYIAGRPSWLKDMLYADKELQDHLMGQLSPNQLKNIELSLDPVDRLYQACVSGGDDGKSKPYDLIREYLKHYPGKDEGAVKARQRVFQHTRLMTEFISRMGTEQYNVVTRLVCTGSEEAGVVEQLHMAADMKQREKVCQIIMDSGTDPEFKAARADLLLREKIAKIDDEVQVGGLPMRPYNLLLRAWGENPYNSIDPATGSRLSDINPSAKVEEQLPLNGDDLRTLQQRLFDPVVGRMCDELECADHWYKYVKDSIVRDSIKTFNDARSDPALVPLIRRAPYKAGEELLRQCNAKTRGNTLLWLRKGCDDDLVQYAERAFGARVEEAAIGTLEGKMQRTLEKVEAHKEKVGVDQWLKENKIGGMPGSDFVHKWCEKVNDELNDNDRWFHTAYASNVIEYYNNYLAGMSPVIEQMRKDTQKPHLAEVEIFANAFASVGGSFGAKLKSNLRSDRYEAVLKVIPMRPEQIAAREQQIRDDDKKAMDANGAVQAELAIQGYTSKAKDLFTKFTKLRPESQEADLRAVGDFLQECLSLKALSKTPEQHGTEIDPKFHMVGGPVNAGNMAVANPTTFPDFYHREYGLDPQRHAVEVARSLVQHGQKSETVCAALHISNPGDIATAAKAPDEKMEITDANRFLVTPGFTVEEAQKRANEVWQILHGTGQIQHIRPLVEQATPEEQRLIHIAFRKLSGGIELTFYIQQALAQFEDVQRAQMDAAVNHTQPVLPLAVGGKGTQEGQMLTPMTGGTADVRLGGDKGNLYEALSVTMEGQLGIKGKIHSILFNDDIDRLYDVLEDATEKEKDEIFKDAEIMRRLKNLCSDEWQWNRVYKVLTNSADLADRLFSRSHGDSGFWERHFGGTDEEGMRKDIKKYFEKRRKQLREGLEASAPKPMTKEVQDQIAAAIKSQLQAESAVVAANPTVRAILNDELSGDELAEMKGLTANAGQDTTEGHLVNDAAFINPEKLIDKIREMTPQERKQKREDPEFMRRLNTMITANDKKREAMNALFSDQSAEEEDHLDKLDKETRSLSDVGQDAWTHRGSDVAAGGPGRSYDPNQTYADGRKVLEQLSHLTQEEYEKLRNDPTKRAQILASLSGDELELARAFLSYKGVEEKGAKKEGGPEPAPGELSAADKERIGYAKFNAVSRMRYSIAERGFDLVLREVVFIYNSNDFRPSPSKNEPVTVPAPAGGDKEGKPAKPVDTADALELEARKWVWAQVAAEVRDYCKKPPGEIGAKGLDVQTMTNIIRAGILREQGGDPSRYRIAENSSDHWYAGDNKKGIEQTIKEASDEQVIYEWSTVLGHEPGSATRNLMKIYTDWKGVRDENKAADEADKKAPNADATKARERKRKAINKRIEFENYILDTSGEFEKSLLSHAGSEDKDVTKAGEGRHIRENREWNSWQKIVREHIKRLPVEKIGKALNASEDEEAMAVLKDPSSPRGSLSDLAWGMEGYKLQRGYGANYNMDLATAGSEGTALDSAATQWSQDVRNSLTAAPVRDEHGNIDYDKTAAQYNVVDDKEKEKIAKSKEEYEKAEAKFKEAKAKVAFWASLIVSVLITLLVTVLTAGMATGPIMVILLGAATGAAAAAGSAAVNEAVLGVDYEKGDAIREIVMGGVTGALSAAGELVGQAGIKFLAGKLAGGSTKVATELATKEVAKQALWKRVLQEAGQEALATSFQGVVEAGAEFIDPTNWIKGSREGWIEGSERAKGRLATIPKEALHAGATAAMSSLAHAPFGGRGKEVAKDAAAEGKLAKVWKEIGTKNLSEAAIQTLAEMVLDPEELLTEGPDGKKLAAKYAENVLEQLKQIGINIHIGDAHHHALVRHLAHELNSKQAHLLTTHERKIFMEIHHEHPEVHMTVTEFIVAREGAAKEELRKKKIELTPAAERAFLDWARNAPDLKEFQRRINSDPMAVPDVKAAEHASKAMTDQVIKQQQLANDPKAREAEHKAPEGPSREAIKAVDDSQAAIDGQIDNAHKNASAVNKAYVDAKLELAKVTGTHREAAMKAVELAQLQSRGARAAVETAEATKKALHEAKLDLAHKLNDKRLKEGNVQEQAAARDDVNEALDKVRKLLVQSLNDGAEAEFQTKAAKLAAEDAALKVKLLAELSAQEQQHQEKPKDEGTEDDKKKKQVVAGDDEKQKKEEKKVDEKEKEKDKDKDKQEAKKEEPKKKEETPDEKDKHTQAMELFGKDMAPEVAKEWGKEEDRKKVAHLEGLLGELDALKKEKVDPKDTAAVLDYSGRRERLEAKIDALIASLGLDPTNKDATMLKLLSLAYAGDRAAVLADRLDKRVFQRIEVHADGKHLVIEIAGKQVSLEGMSEADIAKARWMAHELKNPVVEAWLRGEALSAGEAALLQKKSGKGPDDPLFKPAPDMAEALIAWLESKKRVARDKQVGADGKPVDVNLGNAVDLSKFSKEAQAKIQYIADIGGMNIYDAAADKAKLAGEHNLLDKIDKARTADPTIKAEDLAKQLHEELKKELKPGESELSVEDIKRYIEMRTGTTADHQQVQEQIQANLEPGAIDRLIDQANSIAKQLGIDAEVQLFVTGSAAKAGEKGFKPGADLDLMAVFKPKGDKPPPTAEQLAAFEERMGSLKVNGRLEKGAPGQRFVTLDVGVKAMSENQFAGWSMYDRQKTLDPKSAEGFKERDPLNMHKLDSTEGAGHHETPGKGHPGGPDKPADTKPLDPVKMGDMKKAEEVVRALGGWDSAKKAYAKTDPESMKALKAFRKHMVDTLIREICAKYGLTSESLGSDDLESDYDISLTADPKAGADKSKRVGDAVNEFNTRFRDLFGQESGVQFDTNIYDKGEALPAALADQDPATAGQHKTHESAPPPIFTPEGKKANERLQDIAALMKMRQYIGGEAEWEKYTEAQVALINDPAAKAEMRARMAEANNKFDQVQEAKRAKIEELRKSEPKASDADLDLMASNRLYAEALGEVDKQRKLRSELLEDLAKDPNNAALQAQVDALTFKVREATAYALNFANEAYSSEGALLDVVGNEQGNRKSKDKPQGSRGWDIKLTDGQRLESLNEQFGDALKDMSRADDLVHGAVHVSKYINRYLNMVDAIAKAKGLSAKDMAKVQHLIDALRGFNGEMYALRKNPKEAAAQHDHLQAMLEGAGITSIEKYREILEAITLHMNAASRNRPDVSDAPTIKPDKGGGDDGGGKGPKVVAHDTHTNEDKPGDKAAHEPIKRGDMEKAEAKVRELGGWEAAKKAYAKTDPNSMWALNDFREWKVNQLLDEICAKYGLTRESMGSKDLESDYDLSLTADPKAGPDKSKRVGDAVAEFNKRFRELFHQESGVVFDTNIYDKGEALPAALADNDPSKAKGPGAFKNAPPPLLTAEGKKANERIQDIAALMKVRQYIGGETEWKKWGESQLALIADPAVAAELKARMAEADTKYEQVQEEKKARIEKLRAAEPKASAADIELMASNQLYAEALGEVDKQRKLRSELLDDLAKDPDNKALQAQVDALTVKVREATAYALNFANEAYSSEGALLDVVGNEQMNRKSKDKPQGARGWDIKLTDSQRLESLNEQFGDALKDISRADDLVHGAIHVSKYINRYLNMVDAIVKAKGISGAEMSKIQPLIEKLKSFNGELYALRKDPVKAKAMHDEVVAKLTAAGISNIGQYREMLEMITLHMNALSRSKPDVHDAPTLKPEKSGGEEGPKPTIHGTAGKLEGDFHGNHGTENVDTKTIVKAVFEKVALVMPEGGELTKLDDTHGAELVLHDAENKKVKVHITVGEPQSDGAVARFVRNHDGSFTIAVSKQALADHVPRALAHELAEIQFMLKQGHVQKGAHSDEHAVDNPDHVTAHFAGRVAELKVLFAELDRARSMPGNEAEQGHVKRLEGEIAHLMNAMGLTGPQAQERLEGMVAKVDPTVRKRIALHTEHVFERPTIDSTTKREDFEKQNADHMAKLEKANLGEHKNALLAVEGLSQGGAMSLEESRRVFDELFDPTIAEKAVAEQKRLEKIIASATDETKGSPEVAQAKADLKALNKLQLALLNIINNPHLSQDEKRAALLDRINELFGSDQLSQGMRAAINLNALRAKAADYSEGKGSKGVLKLDLKTGQLSGGPDGIKDMRALIAQVDEANRAARENGLKIEYVIIVHDPVKDADGQEASIVRVMSRPVPEHRLKDPNATKLPSNTSGQGDVTVDVGVGRGNFAGEKLSEADREKGPIVQTEYLPLFSVRAQSKRSQAGIVDAAPIQVDGAVLMFADFLKHPQFLAKRGPDGELIPSVNTVFLNNVSANFKDGDYKEVAKAMAEVMAEGGQIVVQWTDDPERPIEEGGKVGDRGHIEGDKLLAAIQQERQASGQTKKTAELPDQPQFDFNFTINTSGSATTDKGKVDQFTNPQPKMRTVIKMGPPKKKAKPKNDIDVPKAKL